MTQFERSTLVRGDVTGYLLKLIRESIPRTQEQLGVDLDVDRATVQSWESGRRPFLAVPFGQAIKLRQKFSRLGAHPVLIDALPDAAEADLILATTLKPRIERADLTEQPLGCSVLTHRLADLLLWAVLGQTPTFISSLPAAPRRRGPVATGPTLCAEEQRAFFTNLHVLAERAADPRRPNVLLHRQACFLAGMDPTGDSAAWLAQSNARRSHRVAAFHTWSPLWPDVRSVVTSLANQGDPEPLRDFITRAHPDDACQRAALNYSAYWVGEIPYRQPDDSFMPTTIDWRGTRLLRHLVERLNTDHPFIDLNIHNLWALLAARRGLVHDDPTTGHALADRATTILDSDRISAQSRQELTSIVYSLRTEGITSTGMVG
ncbi:helix-turn-helix domain-containing protein [Micromonospora echinofusca]|uniref:Transcriptional regulator n=1 Tax=Micromonospora echinofusca TaxID=47858 RepID=A0ABS3VUM9_MICEH|nr:helix-turn-helix transcriptional regulator [Micromonospora echinofusca]MBO4208200.1 transcriptional regulator [Micromonospora echinofusca]